MRRDVPLPQSRFAVVGPVVTSTLALSRLLIILFLTALATLAASHAKAQNYSPAQIYALNQARTILLRFETPDGTPDYGSGIAIGPSGYVLTAKHLLGGDPSKTVISGLPNWTKPSIDFDAAINFQLKFVSSKFDFAVLKATDRPLSKGIEEIASFRVGEPVVLMGYPGGGNLMLTHGFVSGEATGGRFASDVQSGGGNSGGPVFSIENRLLGLLIEKTRRLDDGAIQLSYALSINAIISDLASDPAAKALADYQASSITPQPIPDNVSPPPAITVAYGFDDTKDDHPIAFASSRKTYRYVRAAQPGYVITGAKAVIEHRNKVISEPKIEIIDGGKALTITYTLESGPLVDQWRGWIDGRIETSQQLGSTPR